MQKQSQTALLKTATLVSFLFALFNHLLPPKAFAGTQLLFDYEFGIIRRGLFGEVLRHLNSGTLSVADIYLVAFLLSLFGAGVFFFFLMRFVPLTTPGYLLAILALNSFGFASFVGNTGYLDALLLSLVLLVFFVDSRTPIGLGLRLLIVAIGVLLHESMLPYFTILIGFELWLTRQNLLLASLPAGTGFLLVGLLAAFAGLSSEQSVEFASHLQTKAAFRLDPNATDVIGRSLVDNFALMSDMRATTKYRAWLLFDGLPLLLMALWLLWLGMRVLGETSGVTRLLLAGTVLAPLSLNVIAFDVVRFGAVSVICGFVAILLMSKHVAGATKRLEETLSWPHFVLLLVLNANIFTLQVSETAGHTSQFPWVLLHQLKWLAN